MSAPDKLAIVPIRDTFVACVGEVGMASVIDDYVVASAAEMPADCLRVKSDEVDASVGRLKRALAFQICAFGDDDDIRLGHAIRPPFCGLLFSANVVALADNIRPHSRIYAI
jgi:hypothetical protein